MLPMKSKNILLKLLKKLSFNYYYYLIIIQQIFTYKYYFHILLKNNIILSVTFSLEQKKTRNEQFKYL